MFSFILCNDHVETEMEYPAQNIDKNLKIIRDKCNKGDKMRSE